MALADTNSQRKVAAFNFKVGNLVELLQKYTSPATPVQMLFPPNHTQPRHIRALADRLAMMLQILGPEQLIKPVSLL